MYKRKEYEKVKRMKDGRREGEYKKKKVWMDKWKKVKIKE